MDPMSDSTLPKEVHTLLIAADAAANLGNRERSSELLRKVREITSRTPNHASEPTLV